MRRASLYVVVIAGTAFATVGCAQSVRRAALVPHMQPIANSGQPMPGPREISLGSPTIGFGDPEEGDDSNAGIEVPRYHFDGAFRVRRGGVDLGFMIDWGLDKGAKSVRDDQPEVDNGDVIGAGITMAWSSRITSELRLGVGLEAKIYSIPWVEYRTEVNGLFTVVDEERDNIAVLSLALIPSYRVAPNVVLFGGVTLRNHPTIQRADIEISPGLYENDEVEFGPGNLVASGGAEVALSNGMRLMAYVYQPMSQDPIKYGPALGINVTLPLGGEDEPAAQPPNGTVAPPPPAGPMGPGSTQPQ